MINGLRNKFILVNMICVTLILVIVFGVVFFYNSSQIKEDSRRTLTRALEFSGQSSLPIQFYLGGADEMAGVDAYNFVIRVDSNGRTSLISTDNVYVKEDTASEIAKKAMDENKSEGVLTSRDYRLRYMAAKGAGEYDIAFVDASKELKDERAMLITCLIAWIMSVAVFFLVSFFLSRWALRPVEKAWDSQKRFAADASHELKTPLTVILANMEILKSNKSEKIEDRIEWVDNTETEAKRMKSLANNLLFLAKNEDTGKVQVTEKVNFSDVAANISLAFEPVAFENDIAIDTTIQNNVFVRGNEDQIRQLITILLDNAVKYSYGQTAIKISLKDASGKAALEINNTGVPIAKEELTNIFDRFYRSDKSRTKEGYGLGLSIAKNIADLHKASISAKSDAKEGTTFTVVFPAYK